MPARPEAAAAAQTREERIEAAMKELRPKIEATVQRMVESGPWTCRRRRSSVPSILSSATPVWSWPTRSGKPAWRAGKKGVRRVQRELRALRVRGQIPLVPAASARDDSWGRLDATGLLLFICGRCRRGFLPYDEALGLTDEVSPGLMPLVCLAGTLLPFADAAQDLLQRFAGVRLSASTVLRDTEGEGERLRAAAEGGANGRADAGGALLTAAREGGQPRPTWASMRSACRCKASGRARPSTACFYTALLYTPGKEHTRYVVDFDLDALAEQGGRAARASPGSAT